MAAVGRGVDVAINKAKTHGMSIVVVNNYSSATGALGVWAKKITSAGLIGIVLSQVCEAIIVFFSFSQQVSSYTHFDFYSCTSSVLKWWHLMAHMSPYSAPIHWQ